MPLIQESIHKLEVAGGMRYFKIGLGLLALIALPVLYDLRNFKDMSTQEAMDAAQLGRNIAEGKGYTTLFVRPFSMFLIKRHNEADLAALPQEKQADPSQIKAPHPDIANPPVYPVVLAGLLKVLRFDYSVTLTRPFWSNGGKFWRYKPDFIIALFNQVLFLGVIVLSFLLARRFFDPITAWASAGLLFGTELLWRFSVSGLSTMLLLLIFTGLVWCLLLAEEEGRESKRGLAYLITLAVSAGLLTGLGGLTRYAFAWLAVPVLLFFIFFGGQQRFVLALAALIAFAAVMTPWVARNYRVSGTPFGTAGYAICETTAMFPEHRLERSLEPELTPPGRTSWMTFWSQKLLINLRRLLQDDVPRLTGNWLGAFFLVGLMVGFTNPAASRLRYFLLACLALLIVIQALGRTQLSEDSPEINSENLLVLAAPLVIIYGVSFFFLLLNQIYLPLRELRYVAIGVFCAIACLPMMFTFLPPRGAPVAYPPYSPPAVQTIGGWLNENEMCMSDIPWAMAWYGQRQSLWLTLNIQPDFYAINDYRKPISVLYLTRVTLDQRFLSYYFVSLREQGWASLILESMQRKPAVPSTFPLHAAQPGWMPESLVLSDWERWTKKP